MDSRKLRHVVALARHLNFTKAAEALNLTQSALSRSIQAIEDECQLRLFDRNRKAVAITAAGREFVRHAAIVLRKETELMEMVSHAARGDGGSIALGMAPLAARTLLGPLVTEMIDKPGFHATVTVGAPKKLLPMLLDESVHICICTGRALAPHPLYASIPLARLRISVVERTDHPLTQLDRVTPTDLDPYPLLRTRSFEMDDDEPSASDTSLLRVPVLAIEDYDVLMKITRSSDAVWVTSPIAAREWIADGTLAQIPIAWVSETPHAQMTAYYLKNRTLSPTAGRILERVIALSREIFDPSSPANGVGLASRI
jgi:DNA-binding transcriptional LysR family regulator